MILSGPNDCRGSTKDARILPAFLHSPVMLSATSSRKQWTVSYSLLMEEGNGLLMEKGMSAVGVEEWRVDAERRGSTSQNM